MHFAPFLDQLSTMEPNKFKLLSFFKQRLTFVGFCLQVSKHFWNPELMPTVAKVSPQWYRCINIQQPLTCSQQHQHWTTLEMFTSVSTSNNPWNVYISISNNNPCWNFHISISINNAWDVHKRCYFDVPPYMRYLNAQTFQVLVRNDQKLIFHRGLCQVRYSFVADRGEVDEEVSGLCNKLAPNKIIFKSPILWICFFAKTCHSE